MTPPLPGAVGTGLLRIGGYGVVHGYGYHTGDMPIERKAQPCPIFLML